MLGLFQVKNNVAINLLFLEAYHNYIKSLYPCAEHDATILAGILLQLQHGDFDPAKQTSQYHIRLISFTTDKHKK